MFSLDVSKEWLQSAVELRWWIAAGVVLAGSAVAAGTWWWRRRAVRALGARHRVQLLPSQTFDPAKEEVLGAATRLHRLPQLAGLLPRRARAVRVQLTVVRGQLEYLLHAPGDARHVLEMPMYHGVEVHSAEVSAERAVPRIDFEGISWPAEDVR